MLFVNSSSAVVYRMIEAWHPTLIVDEADIIFKDNPELRSIVNAGWTRGAGVPRFNQETGEPEFFETFGPKVIGLKGLRLPDTTLSRSIIIALDRKLPGDRVADFDHLDDADLATLRSGLARFAHDSIEQLRGARPVTGISTPLGGETHIDPFEAFKDPSRRLQPKADEV